MKENKKRKLLNKNQMFKQQKESVIASILPELFILLIFLCVITMSTMFFSTFKYYQIKQESMRPLFNNYENEEISDGVFVKIGSDIEVGDVVVLKYTNTTLIKRVIGTGGDKISIVKKEFPNRVEYLVQRIAKGTIIPYTLVEDYINKEDPQGMKKVYEAFQTYIKNTNHKKETIFDGENFVEYIALEEDEFFYLGDNRGSSLDSSRNGPAKIDDIVGRVEIVIWKEQNFLLNIIFYVLGFKNI